MTRKEIKVARMRLAVRKISVLRETLENCVLTIADKVAIRNEIGELQDELLRLDHQDGLMD